MPLHVLERELEIPLPRARVFAFFADAWNLERITPPELCFRVLTAAPIAMRAGARIHYRLRPYGIPFRWETRIARWDPPHAFADEQARGPYRRWIHLHEFRDSACGTVMRDRVDYGLPLWPFGELAHPLVRRQLERIFDYRARAVRRLLGAESAEGAAPPAA